MEETTRGWREGASHPIPGETPTIRGAEGAHPTLGGPRGGGPTTTRESEPSAAGEGGEGRAALRRPDPRDSAVSGGEEARPPASDHSCAGATRPAARGGPRWRKRGPREDMYTISRSADGGV